MSTTDMSKNRPNGSGRLRMVVAAIAVLALAIPASASAHPGVYTVTAKVATTGVTYATDPTGAGLGTQTQYAIANDGWAKAFAETNGLVSGNGMVNYKAMPSGFRNGNSATPATTPMTSEEKRAYVPAQTNVQAHATCDVASLKTGAAILAWQGADPFFNYVPWQKDSAGLGDEPTKWIPVVLEKTGVDLSALSTEAEFKTACEGIGGTYYKADTPSIIDAEAIAAAVEPVKAQVESLLSEKGSLEAQIDAWKAKNGALDGETKVLIAARDALSPENSALSARLSAANKAKAKKDRTIKSLRKQLDSLRGHMH
jgi:hypothetical protein